MRYMSVDYGDVRTGIAMSDPSAFLASALCVIRERNMKTLATKISELAKEHKVAEIVLGFPKNSDNTMGERSERTLALKAMLEEESGLNVVLRDERNTTLHASSLLNETNTRGKKRKEIIDAVSAVIILQDYLDSKK